MFFGKQLLRLNTNMKNTIKYLIFLTIWNVFLLNGQTNERIYKSFTDTTFEVGDKILAPTIHFTLGGGNRIYPKHYDSVQVIANFLASHPSFVVELGTHTDYRGSATYNESISEKRAVQIKSLLIQKMGIKSERIEVKGYGEYDPVIPEEIIQQVETDFEKEKLHAINRRVEIKILKL